MKERTRVKLLFPIKKEIHKTIQITNKILIFRTNRFIIILIVCDTISTRLGVKDSKQGGKAEENRKDRRERGLKTQKRKKTK